MFNKSLNFSLVLFKPSIITSLDSQRQTPLIMQFAYLIKKKFKSNNLNNINKISGLGLSKTKYFNLRNRLMKVQTTLLNPLNVTELIRVPLQRNTPTNIPNNFSKNLNNLNKILLAKRQNNPLIRNRIKSALTGALNRASKRVRFQ